MGFIPEGFQVESPLASLESPPQRRQSGSLDAARPQDKTLRPLQQFEIVTGLNSQRVQNPSRKGDLSFSRYLDEHGFQILLTFYYIIVR
jgi:hypothetical protein